MGEKKFKRATKVKYLIERLDEVLHTFKDLKIEDERKFNRASVFSYNFEYLSKDNDFSKHFDDFIKTEINRLENEFKNL